MSFDIDLLELSLSNIVCKEWFLDGFSKTNKKNHLKIESLMNEISNRKN